MMEDVGDARPPRLRDDCGYRDVYVPATDLAEGSKALAASCCTFMRSFSRVAARLRDFSSSIFVLEFASCNVSSLLCRSWWETLRIVSSLLSFLLRARSSCSKLSRFEPAAEPLAFAASASSTSSSALSSSSPVANSMVFEQLARVCRPERIHIPLELRARF